MKKVLLSCVAVLAVVVLVWCGKSPEQVYLEDLEVQTPNLETLGNAIMDLGDQMMDESFNQAYTTLTLIQDAVDASNLPVYEGSDTNVKTSSEELHQVIDLTREFVSVLRPVLAKVAENPEYIPTPAEADQLEKAGDLAESIDRHMQQAGAAFAAAYPEEEENAFAE